MQTSLSPEIRRHLAHYLAGEIALGELQRWLAGATWDVEQREDGEAADLFYKIELGLAEFSNGDWTEEELKKLWQSLADETSARVSTAS